MRVYKNAWFAKFALKENIHDGILCDAIHRAERGLVDADLGSGLLKQRVAREGEGKSGGFRTLIFFRLADRAVFAFGFAKNDRANLSSNETVMFKKAAKVVLALSQAEIDIELKAGRLTEVRCDDQNL